MIDQPPPGRGSIRGTIIVLGFFALSALVVGLALAIGLSAHR